MIACELGVQWVGLLATDGALDKATEQLNQIIAEPTSLPLDRDSF